MKADADTVSADLSYDGVAVFRGIFVDNIAHIAEKSPWLNFRQTQIEAFLRHADKFFIFIADIADAVHLSLIHICISRETL